MSAALYALATRLQSAVETSEVEQTYLKAIPDVITARGRGLYRIEPESGKAVNVSADVDPKFLEDYEDHGRADDPVLRYVRTYQRPIDSSRLPDQCWERSAARDVLGRAGFSHSMEAPVVVAGVTCGTINFARFEADPTFAAGDLRAARRVSEQLGLALERAMRYETTGRRASMLEEALDRLPQAVVITDLEARPLFGNRVARAEFLEEDHWRSEPVGALMSGVMERFRRENRRVAVTSMPAAAAGSSRRVIIKTMRIGDHEFEASVSLMYSCQDDVDTRLPSWGVLSQREQEIAQLVSEGLTTKQIAQREFITKNTVKQHLKRIFAKVEVHNRAELVQRIWSQGHSDE